MQNSTCKDIEPSKTTGHGEVEIRRAEKSAEQAGKEDVGRARHDCLEEKIVRWTRGDSSRPHAQRGLPKSIAPRIKIGWASDTVPQIHRFGLSRSWRDELCRSERWYSQSRRLQRRPGSMEGRTLSARAFGGEVAIDKCTWWWFVTAP